LRSGQEIDFIAEKNGKLLYVQVATSILDDSTRDREYRVFENIQDHWPKYVVTFDDMDFGERQGVRHMSIMYFEDIL